MPFEGRYRTYLGCRCTGLDRSKKGLFYGATLTPRIAECAVTPTLTLEEGAIARATKQVRSEKTNAVAHDSHERGEQAWDGQRGAGWMQLSRATTCCFALAGMQSWPRPTCRNSTRWLVRLAGARSTDYRLMHLVPRVLQAAAAQGCHCGGALETMAATLTGPSVVHI